MQDLGKQERQDQITDPFEHLKSAGPLKKDQNAVIRDPQDEDLDHSFGY